ncbi:MAG: hypothetical protein LAP40_13665 [Acidobacteriia bacterium]|nr:hypothetical protein [Terriglobia bacterium]
MKFLPSLTDFAFLMPIVFLFARMDGAKTLLGDCDTGWHIRTGEWIVSNHQVPARDVFSFSKAGEPWFAWEWLSDIVFAWLNHHGGLATVVLFSIVLIAVTFLLLFRMALHRANPIVAVVVTMVATAASAIHWLARPHLFSLLFLVLFYRALENVREGRTRLWGVPYLALLPLGTILWTNLHGGFFVGILMLAGYCAGEVLKMAFSADRSQVLAARVRGRNFFLSAVACGAASLINPYFYHLHVHVVQYLFDPFQAQHISEFLTLNFHHPMAMFLEILLILGAGAAIWHAAQGSYTEAVLLLMWGHAALLASRNIPLFGIVAAPVVASAVDAWLKRLPELELAAWLRNAARRYLTTASEVAAIDGMARWHVVSIAAVALVAALLYAPAPPKGFRSEYDPQAYPAGAIAMLRNDSGARIFTNDEWGDYLIYRLYPGHRVFVDGRSDFYGDDFVQKYLDVMNVKYDWQTTLDRFGINTVLLSPEAPLAGALKESSRWRVVYDDGIALIFQPAQKTTGETHSAASATGKEPGAAKPGARDGVVLSRTKFNT